MTACPRPLGGQRPWQLQKHPVSTELALAARQKAARGICEEPVMPCCIVLSMAEEDCSPLHMLGLSCEMVHARLLCATLMEPPVQCVNWDVFGMLHLNLQYGTQRRVFSCSADQCLSFLLTCTLTRVSLRRGSPLCLEMLNPVFDDFWLLAAAHRSKMSG